MTTQNDTPDLGLTYLGACALRGLPAARSPNQRAALALRILCEEAFFNSPDMLKDEEWKTVSRLERRIANLAAREKGEEF